VQRERGGDFAAALQWARARLGEAPHLDHQPRPEARQRAPQGQREARPTADLARRIWRESVPARGTIVERYLAGRGLSLPESPDDPDVIRFHPACPRRVPEDGKLIEHHPAMLAMMTHPITAEPCGVHRTFLLPDGSDRLRDPKGKAMLGKAGVVRISPDDDVTMGLGIAEGIETTLSVMQHAGWRPMWCATSAGAIASFPVLNGIEALTVFADADAAGQRAAERCARRWAEAGREAFIITPREGDWNDVVTREVRR
jgi:hypothetical protein